MSHKKFDSDSEDDEDTGLLDTATDNLKKSTALKEELLASRSDDSDEDDMPEDIGFHESRKEAIQTVKDTLKQIRDEKQNLKERRKKKDELFKKQKEERLQALEKQRLPDDFLQDLDDEPEVKRKKTPEKPQPQNSSEFDNDKLSDCEDEDEDDSFLPVESEASIKAYAIGDFLKKPKSSQERALEFRQLRQYRSNIPRETAQQLKGRLMKQKVRKT